MTHINRACIIIRVGKPYIEWAQSLDDSGILPDPDDDEPTVYLIPNYDYESEAWEILSRCYESIFDKTTNGTMWHPEEAGQIQVSSFSGTTEVRPFTESDRNALREIYLESRRRAFSWADGSLFTQEEFDCDTKGERIWVATCETRPAGFASVWEPENFVHNLFVHPTATGRGIGSALLDEALRHIGRPATLKCAEKNTKARDFYLSKSWTIISNGDGSEGRYFLMQFQDEP